MIPDKFKQLALALVSGIILFCIAVLLFALVQIKSCACNKSQEKIAMLGVRDSSAESIIQDLAKDTAKLRIQRDSAISESQGTEKIIYINNGKLAKEIETINNTATNKLLFELRKDWKTADSKLLKNYSLDSVEIKIVATEHAQNKNFKRNEELYITTCNNLKLADAHSKELINDLRGMLYQKDVQIVKFENTPQTVTVQRNYSWLELSAMNIGSAFVGVAFGHYVIKK